jgi:Cdc6-like AAA superfamily ATPase
MFRCLSVFINLYSRAVEIHQLDKDSELVDRNHVDKAINEMNNSKSVKAIQFCSLHQKVFLLACINVQRKTGVPELIFGDIEQEHLVLCGMLKINNPTTPILHSICSYLGQCRMIIAETLKLGQPKARVKLNIDNQDVFTGIINAKHDSLTKYVERIR